jgi:SAM-dependent methyltransferase
LPDPASEHLELVDSACSICGRRDQVRLVATGEDFEYQTSKDSFSMFRCLRCDSLFLDPRPAGSELGRIYPDSYHAYQFTAEEFGLAFRIRAMLERRRLLSWCRTVPSGGAILDVGAGDGFHLEILRAHGDPTWRLAAVEPDVKAAAMIAQRGIPVHVGTIEEAEIGTEFDFAIMIMVIEHVEDPLRVLRRVHGLLRAGGRVGVVTDNIWSVDAMLGRSRHWGGYHFPRHFNLYGKDSLTRLAHEAGFRVGEMTTMTSPVNWTYTIHNKLADRNAPPFVRDLFTLRSPLALASFTAADLLAKLIGRGALLRAVLVK